MEYNCPKSDRGMVICYIRGEGHEGTLKLYGLDEDAVYRIRDYDDTDHVKTVSGRELTEGGIPYAPLTKENTATRNESGIPAAAKVYLYEKIK